MFCRYFSFFSLCLFLPTQRSSLGHGSSLHGRDTTSLPGFENLTMGYNKYLRPYFGGEPVQIAMSLDIASISSISESDMDYTATICLQQRWTDPRLVFHGNKSFTLDARLVELLWVPDTYVVESKRSFLHDVTMGNRLVRLFSNGTVLYALRITTTVACNMDLSKYPMDTQTCQLQLASWGYDENDVTFTWLRGNNSVHGIEKLRLSQYTVERYHTLVSTSQQETAHQQHGLCFYASKGMIVYRAELCPENTTDPASEHLCSYPRLILQFELRRNVLYFILETYVPSTLLVMLSWVSFWITLDSVPARTCIGVTTVLSMTTLMIGSRSSLSKTNCFIKAIDVYLGICFSFIFGALVEYAVAHYSSSQKCAAKVPEEGPANELTEEMEEVNITNILNNSITSYKQKISFTSIEISSNNVNCSDLTMKSHEKIKCVLRNKMHRIIGYFTIQNPGNVDHYSKLLFPLFFMVVNVFYWAYYLYF
ncbi:gamma-aminobutyric acid receptor subunit pi isoform X2 [Parus major]|uniref:gamma-aminobutyric acid receptor subunit pi isoform X2 n=1 Tax=Parus major TaxID=9157 RepID=UPI000771625D|nr:gamma-aminobutyric acid receptor subunit pi isoform X2 [Parus major]